jgi:hypothetical protein
MSSYAIFYHDRPGAEDLTLRLTTAAGVIVNGTPATLFEVDAETKPLRYRATISENLVGQTLRAEVLDSIGLLYRGWIEITAASAEDEILESPPVECPGSGEGGGGTGDGTVTSFSVTALAQLAGTRQINVSVPTLIGRELSTPLVQGDAYLTEQNAAIEFSRADWSPLPEGCTVQLQAKSFDGQPATITLEGTLPVSSGAIVARFEPDSEVTAGWQPGKYEFQVLITFPDGNVRSFVGPAVFLRVIPPVG